MTGSRTVSLICKPMRLLGRGELAQIVYAEAFFDLGDLVDHALEPGLAEGPWRAVALSRSHLSSLCPSSD
jgi:hypothetical protein